LTIGENAFLAHRWLGHREGGSPPGIDSARLREVLASPDGMLIHLSGGERQILAMELTGRSANRLIMLDEPFAFLSRSGGELLAKYIHLLASSQGVSFIITDHTGLFYPTAAVSLYQISNGTLKAAR
jgi:energy-coupling factor transporter ATP-binding protein EcfA2